MPEVKWIKLAIDIFDNRKIKLIEKMPEGDTLIVVWLKLMCLAGTINDGGLVYLTREIPYTDEMLAVHFDRPLNTIRLALTTFEKFDMIEIIEDILALSSWEEYQNVEGLDKIKEQNRIRKQKQRESRLLSPCRGTGHVTVTHGHSIEEEIDTEKDNTSAPERKVFEHDSKPYRCALYLAGKIKERIPNKVVSETSLQAWALDMDLLNRVDRQEWEDIASVLDFSQQDEFWSKNILSGKNLRKNFDRLYLKMQEGK